MQRIHPEENVARLGKQGARVVNIKTVLVNQRCYEAIYKIPVGVIFAVLGLAILSLPLSISPSGKAVVIDTLRGANTVPDNPSAGVGWVDAVTCVDVFGVMNQYVRGMVDASAAAYPDNNRLMMLTDNIQIHHISLQYGGQWRTTCVPAANLSTDVVKPQCNLDAFEAMRADPFWNGGRDQPIGETSRGNAVGDAVVLYNDAVDDRDAVLARLDYLQNNAQIMCQATHWGKLFAVLREVHSVRRVDVLNLHSLMHGDPGINTNNPLVRAYKAFPRSMLNSSYAFTLSDGNQVLLLILWIIYVVMWVGKLLDEINQARVCRKAGTCYFKSAWNVCDILGMALVFVWFFLTWALMLAESVKNNELIARPTMNLTWEELGRLYEQGNYYNICYALGLVGNAILVTTVLQYMYVHRGLDAIALMFRKAWKQLVDIAAFMGYVGVTLSVAIWIINAYMGNNKDFADIRASLQSTFLLAFGYYDYSAFAPDQQSFNDQSGASIMIFWVLVIILVVIAQNVILAIVSDAYGQAREDLQDHEFSHDGDHSIFGFCFKIIWCNARLFYLQLLRRTALHDVIRSEVFSNKDRIVRQMMLAKAPELATLLTYMAADPQGEVQDVSPWQVTPQGDPAPGAVSICQPIGTTQLVKLFNEASSCQGMTQFRALPFGCRPFGFEQARAAWLAEMLEQVYGVPVDGCGSEEEARAARKLSNDGGMGAIPESGSVGASPLASFTQDASPLAGAAGGEAYDGAVAVISTHGSSIATAAGSGPVVTANRAWRGIGRTGQAARSGRDPMMEGLVSLVEQQQRLLQRLLAEQQEQRAMLVRMGGGAGGAGGAVAPPPAAAGSQSLRARADMGL